MFYVSPNSLEFYSTSEYLVSVTLIPPDMKSVLVLTQMAIHCAIRPTTQNNFVFGALADPGGEFHGVRPPLHLLKNNVKGFNPKYKKYRFNLERGVKFTGNALYFYQKLIFSSGTFPDPLVMVCLM